ncbi:hydrolase [Lacinutrix sp. Bg11-31]|uniref:hydrolase n=1 Tax=Lacinutrix sp. Bg11-31 TaxID=2057808 RepID=UPI000C3123C6|nr:hydrolase [Lacinutrix sp. Bg11-31]AUC81962.1 hydrolase [Lacinutrix sp. Bg11-31]
MKNRIFMYLFIFSVLLLLFNYINSKKIFDDSNVRVANSKEQVVKYRDSILTLKDDINSLSQFSFDYNEYSYDYFLKQGYDVEKLMITVKDALYAQNEYEGDQHPLVPYASTTGKKILINSIRVLNHKWIIADFTDGQLWGEMLVVYSLNDKGELNFRVSESLLNPM